MQAVVPARETRLMLAPAAKAASGKFDGSPPQTRRSHQEAGCCVGVGEAHVVLHTSRVKLFICARIPLIAGLMPPVLVKLFCWPA